MASTSKAVVVIPESPSEDNREPSPGLLRTIKEDGRPIMMLLRRLIQEKQSTIMTNTEIIEILKREYDINVDTLHELELDIYIKVVKKFLKDWPQWEELEEISTKLSTTDNNDTVTKILTRKYKELKEYLGVMLDATKPLAKKAVSDVKKEKKKKDNINSKDVVMEVYCTRDQLNHLFYRRPRRDQNNTIFNISKVEPTHTSLTTLSFESILHFWWTKICIHLPNFTLSRELYYKYNHTLVNKVREEDESPLEVLDTQMFNKGKKAKNCNKSTFLSIMNTILAHSQKKFDANAVQFLTVIFNVIKKDMEDVPEVFRVPSNYKKYANRYKYLRYLYVDNAEDTDARYDLQLEEMVAPSYQLFIGKVGRQAPQFLHLAIKDWLRIECMMCKKKFQHSTDMISVLQAHFNEHHQNEPDWQCQHCKQLFSIDFLAENRWYHKC